MFDGQSIIQDLEFLYDELEHDKPCIQSIIQQCSELPELVRATPINKTFERVLDDHELDRITNPLSVEEGDNDAIERLVIRRKSLRPFLGRCLTSTIIRVPGLYYTVEVDVDSDSVVHWEWQTL